MLDSGCRILDSWVLSSFQAVHLNPGILVEDPVILTGTSRILQLVHSSPPPTDHRSLFTDYRLFTPFSNSPVQSFTVVRFLPITDHCLLITVLSLPTPYSLLITVPWVFCRLPSGVIPAVCDINLSPNLFPLFTHTSLLPYNTNVIYESLI